MQSAFLFILEEFSGVEVKALCRLFECFLTNSPCPCEFLPKSLVSSYLQKKTVGRLTGSFKLCREVCVCAHNDKKKWKEQCLIHGVFPPPYPVFQRSTMNLFFLYCSVLGTYPKVLSKNVNLSFYLAQLAAASINHFSHFQRANHICLTEQRTSNTSLLIQSRAERCKHRTALAVLFSSVIVEPSTAAHMGGAVQ